MKKILICLLCVVSCITLVGCNAKKDKVEYAECSITQETDDFNLDTSIKITIKNNKFTNATFKADYLLSERLMDYQDKFKDGIEKEFETFEQQYGVKVETSIIDEGVRVTLDMTAEQFEKIYNVNADEDVTKKELIEEFEESGYTCK